MFESQDTFAVYQDQKKDINYNDRPVPIYKMQKYKYSFKATLQPKINSFYARGSLVGQFYTLQKKVILHNISFQGKFEGVIEKKRNAQKLEIYFQGNISQFLMLASNQERTKESIEIIQQLKKGQNTFKGFFKGVLLRCPSTLRIKDIKQLREEEIKSSFDCTEEMVEIINRDKKINLPQYFLPTTVCFQVQDVRKINLSKCMAVVSGYFTIEIHYNSIVKEMIKNTNAFLKQKRKQLSNQQYRKKFQKLLKIQLNFQRDFNLTLNLQEQDQQDSKVDSQGSEWSIMDKTWDIEQEDDESNKVFRFKIWKRFNTEIDNSYGSFFAPFNLSVLRIVMTLHHFLVKDAKEKTIKIHLVGADFKDYDPKYIYNPFATLESLQEHKPEQDRTFHPQLNRIHKITSFNCKNTASYIIADNRLILFPFYKNILINKNTANDRFSWKLGISDKLSLMSTPDVRTIVDSYHYALNSSEEKASVFSFQKWSYIIVQIPIYKYIVIEMLGIFVPLTLLSVISLLIFNVSNGISTITQYPTLAYCLANVCSLMIAYVSLIPIIRSSLPPMAGLILVDIIAYIATIPSLMALANSMLNYTAKAILNTQIYIKFSDALFLAAFTITVLNNILLVLLFIAYFFKDYTVSKANVSFKTTEKPKVIYQYRSPGYIKFMEQIGTLRTQQFKIQVLQV